MEDKLKIECKSFHGEDALQSNESNEEEYDEFNIVEYARFYGLCQDFTKLNALEIIRPPLLSDNDNFDEVFDPIHGASVRRLEEAGLQERLNISQEAAAQLRWMSSLKAEDPPIHDLQQFEPIRLVRLQVEVPLLRTDHDLDMRTFRALQLDDQQSRHDFLFEELVEEADQGLTWPSTCNELPAQYDVQLKAEKISVRRDVLLYMQSTIKDDIAAQDEKDTMDSILPDRTSTAILEPLTPPLLPLSPPRGPCIPSSPAANLELLSESTNTTVAEAEELEQRLFKNERLMLQGVASDSNDLRSEKSVVGQVYAPLQSITDTPPSPLPKRMRPEDLKVEGPMTPPMTFESPGKRAKKVSFKASLEDHVPEIPSIYMSKEDNSLTSEAEYDKYFDEMFRPLVEEAEKRVQHEQLREGGNVPRVNVPVLDFTMSKPPWTEFVQDANRRPGNSETELTSQKRLLLMIKHENLRNEKPWPGISKLERHLTWTPFPAKIAKLANEEQVQGDGTLVKILEQLNMDETIDSASLTWKPEGLRILDASEEEDDDLEEGVFIVDEQDMRSLIRKRRLEMDGEEKVAKKIPPRSTYPLETSKLPQREIQKSLCPPAPEAGNEAQKHDSGLMFGGLFSAATALQNYMSLHSGRRIPATEESQFKKPEPAQEQPFPAPSNPREEAIGRRSASFVATEPPPTKALPFSTLSIPTTPTTFFINSQILTQRHLFRRLEQLFSAANFVSRDSVPFSSAQSSPYIAPDADLTLSPSTGLLWTTLQRIKQRPLPGQASTQITSIKSRIAGISRRYERLLVLVSEGAIAPSPPARFPTFEAQDPSAAEERSTAQHGSAQLMDERDALALADLIAFATGMEDEGEVSVSYVPGGEDELAHWIVGLMVRFGMPGWGGRVVREETLWEGWLRRAGMNAFAAQAVLGELRAHPEKVELGDGLGAFVRMGREERIRRFEGILGGRRVLERVGRVLHDSRF
ncbi:hypothetical protein EV356DRAFT_571965 [Viridothelium virens]|uniref:Uncharacterized protein n=1 Tax=Viridothelium virens TaxID=1048519 RepID=A0A6A6HP43_VIRVR|nr:hypothetical protein EV356DRAFT_571965 [Viridothelium virens]